MHYTVLLHEAVEALVSNADGLYVDGTYGRGGHSREILKHLSDKGRLIAVDKDPQAIADAQELEKEDSRFSVFHGSFVDLAEASGESQLDGVLLDLGVSSPQLDQAERGFSFMQDGPLDMRMDTSKGMSAREWLAVAELDEMSDVFKRLGEEKFGKRVAHAIVEYRAENEIVSTLQLVEIIESAMPIKDKFKHPATRVFQAIRIFINAELDDLADALGNSVQQLKQGGRLVIISFHSLEDRMVKRFIRQQAEGEKVPRHIPIVAGQEKGKTLKAVGKAIKASATEIAENTRSRSAVMRVAEKL